MSEDIRELARGFPAQSPGDWRELALGALKGADFDRTLVRTTADGIARGPVFFDRPSGSAPLYGPRDAYLPWAIRQSHGEADPAKANANILADLAGGVSEVSLRLDEDGTNGIAAASANEIRRALEGVDLSIAPVHVEAGGQDGALLLAEVLKDRPDVRGGFGLPPGTPHAAELAKTFSAMFVNAVDARAVFDAGGSEVQEVAFMACGFAEAMRGLIDHGVSNERAANSVEVRLAADADIHLTIAKLRAARIVSARILDAFGVSGVATPIHAVTAYRMMTRRDPWTNLIRVTAAGFAAAAGGADAITIRPVTAALGRPTPFAQRVARNLQIMLQEESHLGRVADPAAGSFLHETLTRELAQQAWSLFQTLESEGGYENAVGGAAFRKRIAEARAEHEKAYRSGKESLIGINAFPELHSRPVEALPGHDIGHDAPFEPVRFAAPFEAFRDAAEKHERKTGHRPTAFLATLGSLAESNARATFSQNHLAVGGVEVTRAAEYTDAAACVAAFKDSGVPMAVISGTDAAYAERASELASELKQAGAKTVWLAGRPLDGVSGIDRFIHLRSDRLDDLQDAHAILGVKA